MPNRSLVIVLDVLCVLVFVTIGRSSHAEALALTGLSRTAWPFLAGLACGELAGLRWREPASVWPAGVVNVASTVVIGMLLRVVSGQGIAVAFVVVATVFLAIFLLGWRQVASLMTRHRSAG